jgi:hypothetical protein
MYYTRTRDQQEIIWNEKNFLHIAIFKKNIIS